MQDKIKEDDDAKPMGVVGTVCPVTNPIVTSMYSEILARKAGNAIIFAPHLKADDFTWRLTQQYQRTANVSAANMA